MRKTTLQSLPVLTIFLAISALLIEVSVADAQIVAARGVLTRGRIVGPDGRGVAGANITVVEFEQPRPYVSFTVTETDGSFSFTTQEGTFVFQITTPLGSGAASATIAGVSLPATIELERGFDVRGKVVDESGNPAENVSILAQPQESNEWAIALRGTGPDGFFGAGLRPGIYDIQIGFFGIPEGLVPRTIRNVTITSDTDLGDIVLSSGQTIGTVRYSSGRPAPGVRVFLSQNDR